MKVIDEKDDAADKAGNVNENKVKTTAEVRESAIEEAGDEPDPEAVAQGMELYDKLLRRHRYPNWIDLLAVIGIFLVSSALVQVAYYVAAPFIVQPAIELVTFISYTLSLVLAIIFIVIFQRHRGVRKNFIRLNISRMSLPLVLWGFLLVMIISVVLEPLLELFDEKYIDMINRSLGSGGWAILSVVVAAPILEEIFFRGLIAGPVKERNGAWAAIFISAAIFGVIHIIPQQVVYAFAIGIVLGYIYVKTDSLAAVMVIHALNNGIAYISTEIMGGDNFTMRGLIGNDTLYYMVYGGCLVILAIAVWGMVGSLKGKRLPWRAGLGDGNPAQIQNNKKS